MNDKADETPEVKPAEETVAGQTDTGAIAETGTQDNPEKPGTAETANADERRAGGRNRALTLFLFALFAVAAGAAGYLFFDISKGRKANEAEHRALAAGVDALQRGHASLTEKTRLLDEQLAGLLRMVKDLYRLGNTDIGWQLEEVNYLLLIASHRLALARDVDTALAILQSIDNRLGEIADPALIPVREQLIADMNRLRAALRTDFTGLALVLSELSGRADELPLNPGGAGQQSALPPDPEPAVADNKWRRLAGNLWQELKTLVVISRTENNTAALLAPQERYFLYQNLRLRLETARLALLIGDADQFEFSIKACTDWLDEYFDTGDQRVRDALASLKRAGSVNLQEAVPSIDATLRAFDEYLAGQSVTPSGSVTQP